MPERPKITYEFYSISMKMLNQLFMDLDKLIIKFIQINNPVKLSRKKIHKAEQKMTREISSNQIYNKAFIIKSRGIGT